MSHNVIRFTSLVAVFAISALSGHAQYMPPGGGMTGGPTAPGAATPTYTNNKSYGISGAAIGGIVAGAAVGGGIAYWKLHNRPNLVGCVQESGGGVAIQNEKDGKLYRVEPDSTVALARGERVALKGQKMEANNGQAAFRATKMVKDYGSCEGTPPKASASILNSPGAARRAGSESGDALPDELAVARK